MYSLGTRQPGVSIIIPNWNHFPFLERSIHSAIRATRELKKQNIDSEVLVIDDASRDASIRLLRTLSLIYSDRLRCVLLSENGGLPAARNLGLQSCRYQYCLMLDSDNEVVPENLPLFYRAIVDTKAALVYGNLLLKTEGRFVKAISNQVVLPELFDENYIDALCLLDGAVVRRLGGYTTQSKAFGLEDWELNLHLLSNQQELIFVPAVLGIYHARAGSMLDEAKEKSIHKHIWRVFHKKSNAKKVLKSRGRMYHPSLGFLISGKGDSRVV